MPCHTMEWTSRRTGNQTAGAGRRAALRGRTHEGGGRVNAVTGTVQAGAEASSTSRTPALRRLRRQHRRAAQLMPSRHGRGLRRRRPQSRAGAGRGAALRGRTHEDGGRVDAADEARAAAGGGRRDLGAHDLQQRARRVVRARRLQDGIHVAKALREGGFACTSCDGFA